MTRQAFAVGGPLPPVTYPPITRTQLALFAGGSGDHNPMHVDVDFARSGGMDDVFAHGMLVMALLGRAVTLWGAQAGLEAFSSRFVSMTQVGDRLTCSGEIRAVENGTAAIALAVVNQDDQTRLAGEARFKLS